MPKKILRFIAAVLLVMSTGCREKPSSETCRLVVRTQQTSLDSITIYRTGFSGSSDRLVFRGVLYGPKDSAVFELPRNADSLYQLRFQYAGKRTVFVTDLADLSIRLDQKNSSWETTPGSTTAAMQILITTLQKSGDSAKMLRQRMNGLSPGKAGKQLSDSLSKALFLLDSASQAGVIRFCDTIHSPAAFLFGYSLFQPRDRYLTTQMLIRRGLNRFPKSTLLTKMDSQMTVVAGIYEGELKPGDSLPLFTVQSLDGQQVQNSGWKGRICLINIWAPWQPGAYGFMLAQKKLLRSLKADPPELVSIAFDDDPAACLKMVKALDAHWTQLIDTAMWLGPTARALKNDSLPYNFLVSAEGQILDKAIPADSLLSRVEQAIKRGNRY